LILSLESTNFEEDWKGDATLRDIGVERMDLWYNSPVMGFISLSNIEVHHVQSLS